MKYFKGIVVLCVLISLTLFFSKLLPATKDPAYELIQTFTTALDYVKRYYVDIDKVDFKQLCWGAIEGMLKTLQDPYTRFLPPKQYTQMIEETEGCFGGLGMVITSKEGKIIVISPIEDTPAERAGVRAGDHITHIDGVETKDMSLQEAVRRLRGPKGSVVSITIIQEGSTEPIELKLVRDIIQIIPVKHEIINSKIAYLRITNFNRKTEQYLSSALDKFEKANIEGVIIDLRNNSGGLLEVALACVSKFLPNGATIVQTKGKGLMRDKVYRAKSEKVYNFVLVILVNRGTASGAEIFAGALQDHPRYKYQITTKMPNVELSADRYVWRHGKQWIKAEAIAGSRLAWLIGENTFGKNSVQTVLDLPDGSAISITTARYYTPKGRQIDGCGLKVDEQVTDDTQLQIDRHLEMLCKEFVRGLRGRIHPQDIQMFISHLKAKGMHVNEDIINYQIEVERRKYLGKEVPLFNLPTDKTIQQALFYLVKELS